MTRLERCRECEHFVDDIVPGESYCRRGRPYSGAIPRFEKVRADDSKCPEFVHAEPDVVKP